MGSNCLIRSRLAAVLTLSWIVLHEVAVAAPRNDRRSANDRLTIRPVGALFTKPLGGAMLMTCIANPGLSDDNEVTDLRWLDPSGQEVVDRTGRRRYIEADGNNILKLYITSISPEEEGVYTCRAMVGGRLYEKTTTIRIFKDITFESAPSPQYLRVNTTGLIRCVVSAQPEAVITWRFNNTRLTPGGRYTMTSEGLVISNVSPDGDSGVYDCRGSVDEEGRYDERSIVVAVHEPPRLIKGPDRIESHNGTEGSISCHATGTPPPVFNFFKNGNLVVSSTRILIDDTNGVGTIRFKPINKSDEGRYRCEAVNTVGQDYASGELLVLVKPTITEFHSVTASESTLATITCIAAGDPIPDIAILKAGRQLSYQRGLNEGGRILMKTITRGHVEMTWNSVTPEDTSEYICVARNRAGFTETKAKLTVNYPPTLSSYQNQVSYIWAGVARNISCSAHGEPYPTFEWTRSGRVIGNNDTFAVFATESSSHLQIRVREIDQGWIYGSYRCTARNILGQTDVDIDVQRASVPDAPKSVTVEASLPDAVELHIESPEEDGGMPVIGYRIQHDDVVEDFDDPEGRVRIPNLKPSSNYLIRIKARNSVGYGNHVEMRVLTTTVGRPLPVVITSPAVSDSSSDYRVTWELRSRGGLQINKYQFVLSRVYTDDFGIERIDRLSMEVYSGADMKHYDLKHLVPDSQYRLTVRARNDYGWSDSSSTFVFRTAPADSHALPNSYNSSAQLRYGSFYHLMTSCVVAVSVTLLLLRQPMTTHFR